MTTIELLTEQLEEPQTECSRLQKENDLLKQKLANCDEKPVVRKTEKIVKSHQHHPASISMVSKYAIIGS
jgi:regulator of replication initiation timing